MRALIHSQQLFSISYHYVPILYDMVDEVGRGRMPSPRSWSQPTLERLLRKFDGSSLPAPLGGHRRRDIRLYLLLQGNHLSRLLLLLNSQTS